MKSVAHLVFRSLNQFPSQKLFFRENNQWSFLTYSDFAKKLCHLSLALTRFNPQRLPLGIMGTSSPDWILFDLASMISGSFSIPFFACQSKENFSHQLSQTQIRTLFIDPPELYEYQKELLEKSDIQIITRDETNFSHLTLNELLRQGEKIFFEKPGLIEQLFDKLSPDRLFSIIYTSGTTGFPKGVMLTHRNLCHQITSAKKRFPLNPHTDRALTFLPFAHIFERMVIYYYLSSGVEIWFLDDPHQVISILPEVQPTVFTTVPRLLEKVYTALIERFQKASGFKKMLASTTLSFLLHNRYRFLRPLLDRLVFRKIRERFGGRIRTIITGSAPIRPEILNFFNRLGIPVYEGYGLTEASPVVSTNFEGHNKIGTVGLPFPEVEVIISEDKEILVRGPNVMLGYYRHPDKTKETIDSQGYLHTGDLGEIDEDGYLKITGRKKELFKLSTGKYVSPPYIESLLNQHPLIEHSIVVVEGLKFPVVLLFPEKPLSVSENLKREIERHIRQINEKLNEWEQIKAWKFLSQPLSMTEGTLTPTLKLCRKVVLQKFQKEIESVYEEAQKKNVS